MKSIKHNFDIGLIDGFNIFNTLIVIIKHIPFKAIKRFHTQGNAMI